VRDLLKLKAIYNDQIADLKSTNKQLQRELYAKQVKKDEECSLVTDRATKSRLNSDKLHAEALAQLITEMIDLHDQDMVRKCMEMRAVAEKAKVDRKTYNLVSQLYFKSQLHNLVSFGIISHPLLSFHLFLPTSDYKQSIE